MKVWSGFLILILACGTVWAQATAQISGSVRDQSGAFLPGVEISATQTETGIARSTITNETGSYVLPNLPIGPYRLEASLPGFRTFVQTGIVLQVNANPEINPVLEVGQVTEQIEVQADAALVETRTTSVGQVIDNVRVVELPLNGRQVTELVILSGQAVGGGGNPQNRTYPTDVISVGGGLDNALVYLLDGGTHNDPGFTFGLPLPFPDALQEFKVETSAVPAQYGQHSAGFVNAVTKSGTNAFHGSLFEFFRNGRFNARDAFTGRADGLRRNQFGGVIGGPIVRNKLFFFAGNQTTIQKSEPTPLTAFVPTARMLQGDWTAVTAPPCTTSQINLRQPFVNNRIDPAQFARPAIALTKFLPTPIDECGTFHYGFRKDYDENLFVGKVDYQISNTHSLSGRYLWARWNDGSNYDGVAFFSLTEADFKKRVKSFTLNDTFTFSPNTVSSFRATLQRTTNDRKSENEFFNLSDLGARVTIPEDYGKLARISVSGAFQGTGINAQKGVTATTVWQLSEDLSLVRGAHQIGLGGTIIHSMVNYTSGSVAVGNITFNTTNTGHSLGDLMIGRLNEYQQSPPEGIFHRQDYVGIYAQDTWKATSKLTVNAGLRWEPYFWMYDAYQTVASFKKDWFDQGLRSKVYPNAPIGAMWPGDLDIPKGTAVNYPTRWWNFAPRLGLAYDPAGDGKMVIRAAYGILFDSPHLIQYRGLSSTPPRSPRIIWNGGTFEDPWLNFPGGDPFPIAPGSATSFVPFAVWTVIPQDTKPAYINQWNLSLQRQLGADWLLAANYVGNRGIHMMYASEANPAVYDPRPSCVIAGRTYTPCSSVGNTNQRRVLHLQNPTEGQYYGAIVKVDTGGTRSYDAMVLTVQRRRSRGITILGNYTWSHCLDDGYTGLIQNGGAYVPERRMDNRGNCDLDRRHIFNLSTVYQTPEFANAALKWLATGWRMSGIVRVTSGDTLTISSGLDTALTGTSDQRPNQILPSPYAPNKSAALWLNPAAFAVPATGTYGTMGRANVLGPGAIRVDMGLTRTFQVREGHSLEFRAEAFNLPNHVNPGSPQTSIRDARFGQILSAQDRPRIMQFALKYVF
jgi:hypothetical protein